MVLTEYGREKAAERLLAVESEMARKIAVNEKRSSVALRSDIVVLQRQAESLRRRIGFSENNLDRILAENRAVMARRRAMDKAIRQAVNNYGSGAVLSAVVKSLGY